MDIFSVRDFSATTCLRILKFGAKLDSDELYGVTKTATYCISRILTRILKIGVKCCLPEKFGVLPYFSIGTFEKVGVRIKKLK